MKLTPAQRDMAAAVRNELLLMFQDANGLMRRALTLELVCRQSELPAPDGALVPALGPAVLAAEAAHDAYAEFTAAAGEPLKVAA